VLDAGGTRDSVFLPGLARLGFRNLLSFNLDEPHPGTVGHVSYARADITRTGANDQSFDFVACLSVLEHGVDWRLFLAEMVRVIVPGGHLFISVDYWGTPIDPGGQVAFGAPVKVFAPAEVDQMVVCAKRIGLKLTSDLNLNCRDAVVQWLGMRFTFLNLLFCRE
jgi:SAM-dependent methyltransferase